MLTWLSVQAALQLEQCHIDEEIAAAAVDSATIRCSNCSIMLLEKCDRHNSILTLA
jgi:hypothetical protein